MTPKRPHPKDTPPASEAPVQAPGSERLGRLLGALTAVLVVGFFFYPTLAHPIQNLGLCGLLMLMTVGLVIGMRTVADSGVWADVLAALGRWPVWAALALGLWAAVRWSFMLVPAPGREWVLGLLWMGVAAGCGVGLAVFDRRQSTPDGSLFVSLRRGLALAAIGFGLYALYQYFISYPRMLDYLQSETAGQPVADLKTESLIHAFRERRIGGRLGDGNLFAAQLSVLAVFGLGCLQRAENLRWRCVGCLGFILAAGAILLTRSRGGVLTLLLAVGLGLAGLWPLWRAKSNRDVSRFMKGSSLMLCVVGIGVLTLLSAAPWLVWAQGDTTGRVAEGWLARVGNIATVRERLFYWLIALKIWLHDPIAGAGPGSFSLLYMTYKPDIARESMHAHSWVFHSMAELGLIGLGVMLIFWGALTGKLWQAWRGLLKAAGGSGFTNGHDAYWCLAAVMLLCFNGLMQFTLQWRVFLILTGLLAGLACGALPGARSAEMKKPDHRPSSLSYLSVGMAVFVLVLALAMTPRFHLAAYHKIQGDDWMETGQYAQAFEAYERAARWLPDQAELLVSQAGAKALAGEPSLAWPLLVQAGNLNPYSASIRAAQARWLWSRDRRTEAIVRMGEAIEHYPNDAGHRLTRARMFLDAGRHDEARADVQIIQDHDLPLGKYQRPPYESLCQALGLESDG